MAKSQFFDSLFSQIPKKSLIGDFSMIDFPDISVKSKISIEVNGIWYHSRKNPEREADRLTKRSKNHHHLILLGCGLGYAVKAAKKAGWKSVLIIEPDPIILGQLIVRTLDLLIEWKELSIFNANNISDFEDLLPWLQGKIIDQIKIVHHPPSFLAQPSLYLPLQKSLKSLLYKRSVNQATIIKFQKLWTRNAILNQRHIATSASLSSWINLHKGSPLVIIGAGPSLEQGIEQLKIIPREKYLAIAADTALIPCLNHKFKPDAVIAADPQWINHYFCHHPQAKECTWILDPVVVYAMSHFLEQRQASCVYWDNVFAIDHWFRKEDRGSIAHGGSATTNAVDIARQLKSPAVLFIGQDLAFLNHLAHIRGASLENLVYSKNNRTTSMELHNFKQLTSLPKVMISSIHGEKIFTNAKMKIFIDWLGDFAGCNREIQWFNASQGAAIPNIQPADSARFLDYINQTKKLIPSRNLKQLSKSKNEIKFVLVKANELSKRINHMINLYQRNITATKNQKHKEISILDSQIREDAQVGEIIGLGAQASILQITEKGEIIKPEDFYNLLLTSAQELKRDLDRLILSCTQFQSQLP